ncbi:WbqC family protein [Acidobacteriota bacterium]
MKIVSIHQPAYLPWLGYFHKAALSDVFIFLDTVQFEKNSFTNRNRIMTGQGPIWLTVPLTQKGHIQKKLTEMQITDSDPWKKKHIKSIRLNYSKTPHFNKYFEEIENSISQAGVSFCDFVYSMTSYFFRLLNIDTSFVRSSNLPVSGEKASLVKNLCKHFQADIYISGALGRDYLNKDEFMKEGIKVIFQDYIHPSYSQLSRTFESGMGIIDVLMNLGASKTKDLIFSGNVTRVQVEEANNAS